MPRHADWDQRLNRYLEEHAAARFDYGVLDCALFCAGAVYEMTGTDPAAAFRGMYRSAASSVRALSEIGQGTLEATVDAMFKAIHPAMARRGDLALHDGSLGVVIGGDALFLGDENGVAGLIRIPRAEWQRCWTV